MADPSHQAPPDNGGFSKLYFAASDLSLSAVCRAQPFLWRQSWLHSHSTTHISSIQSTHPTSSKEKAAPAAPVTAPAGAGDKELVASLEKQVAEQGDKVRELKGNKADVEVALLLDLKKKLSITPGVPLLAPSGKKGKKK